MSIQGAKKNVPKPLCYISNKKLIPCWVIDIYWSQWNKTFSNILSQEKVAQSEVREPGMSSTESKVLSSFSPNPGLLVEIFI